VALKLWSLEDGKEFVKNCVVQGLNEPLEKVRQTTIASVFSLSIFNPEIDLNDIINGFKEGLFVNFNFVDSDITLLSNLNILKLRSASSAFTRRILDQLHASSMVGVIAASREVDSLFKSPPWTAARYKVIVCRSVSDDVGCDRRAIYLSEIMRSL